MPDYATWTRRFVALALDWAASTLVTVLLFGARSYAENPDSGWWVLGVFAMEVSLLTAFAGGSFGQLLVRIRVQRTNGQPVGLGKAVLRTLLICLVIPPLVFKSGSGRGLHDLATDTAAYARS